MSKFSLPSDLEPDDMTNNLAAMTEWMNADGDNLVPFVTQSAGAAAMAASMGLGMASHVTGTMLGMFEGMMSVSMKAAQGQLGNSGFPVSRTTLDAFAEDSGASTKTSNVVSLKSAKKAKTVKDAAAKTAKAEKQAPKSNKTATATSTNAASLAADAGLAKLISALEPEDYNRPAEIEKPDQADDLKLISGIGPKLEKVLNSLGIWTFAQVAKWTPNEIAWLDDYLQFSGRIERDNWMAQAAALAAGGRDEYLRVFGKEPR